MPKLCAWVGGHPLINAVECTCPPGHCRHPKTRVDIANEGKREPIVRLGARRSVDRFEGSIYMYFGTDECGKFVMSSLFFAIGGA